MDKKLYLKLLIKDYIINNKIKRKQTLYKYNYFLISIKNFYNIDFESLYKCKININWSYDEVYKYYNHFIKNKYKRDKLFAKYVFDRYLIKSIK